MLRDSAGLSLRSKRVVREDDTSVTFQYKPFPVSMTWGLLERKPWQSARQRYEREKRLSLELHQQGLRVPEVIEANDETLELRVKRLNNSGNFLNWVVNGMLTPDTQEQCLYDSLILLKEIHKKDLYHGDSYIKNFLLKRNDRNITVHTTGLQYERDSPNPQMTDIQLLVASAISGLHHRSMLTQEDIYRLARSSYGMLGGANFTARDKLFYSLRFGVDKRFFQFFERGY